MAKFRLNLSETRVNAVIGGESRASIRRAAHATQRRVRENIKRTGRIDTGKMLNSVEVEDATTSRSLHPWIRVKVATPYAKYQEFGTRAHGPVKARFLRFKPKGSGSFVFAKWVRGVKAAHFMRDAYNDITPQDFLPRGKQ